MSRADGQNYAPQGRPAPVCARGDFRFAATGLDHGHIYAMCQGLIDAGGELTAVYDHDPERVAAFQKAFPGVQVAAHRDALLDDSTIQLVAAAAIPNERGPLGLRVMAAGKDYFTDKTPFTADAQLDAARAAVAATGQKYMVYYSERLHVECAVYANQLIDDGIIGRVIHVLGTGPHRLNAPGRPAWFFNRVQYGGILCDIGSHQVEQFLSFSGAQDATVRHAAVANYANPDYPELEDFGEANLVADNGAANYFRVDWFTPDGLRIWGDGRTFIVGTKGSIELRKYIDVTRDIAGDHVFLVTEEGEYYLPVAGKVGFPFFGQLILDCLNRTENAMTQAHAFKAAELCLRAQALADESRLEAVDKAG